jgi:hypothetical protein
MGWRRGWYGYGRAWGYPNGTAYSYGAAPYYGYPGVSELTPKQEADMLKEEAKAMQDEIKSINQRISELESASKKAK